MKTKRLPILFLLSLAVAFVLSFPGLAEDDALSKYNFVPGEKLIAAEDFSTTAAGDIPTGSIRVNGEAEVVIAEGERWLKLGPGAEIVIDVPKVKDLTLEFYLKERGVEEASFRMFLENESKEYGGWFDAGHNGIHYEGTYGSKPLPINVVEKNYYRGNGETVQYALTLQPERARLYINKTLAMNAAGFSPVMPSLITIRFSEGESFMVKDISVATEVPDIANELLVKGKYVSHGIHFDVGSAKLKEESYSVLKQVAEVMKTNPDFKVRIDGHTDNTGTASVNQKLSLERAESVKQYLVSRFGIDTGRLQTRGAGSNEPVADNKTIGGRTQNRRVEFLKL